MLAGYGMTGHNFESNGKGGFHVRYFAVNVADGTPYSAPYVPSEAMHWLGVTVRDQLKKEFPTVDIESFPKQPDVNASRPFGNVVRISEAS